MASELSMQLLGKREVENHMSKEKAAFVHPKKRKNSPDSVADVIALSPTTLMAKNRFTCEVCFKGFPREQNLQLHKRGHNLPWKLKQKAAKDKMKRKVYLCPVRSCVHHDPLYALGDLSGIRKHYSRKHGEKKYNCPNCRKMYAVLSDLKAHSKTCGTREYRCHCGTLFSRRDSFVSHRTFCEVLGHEVSEIKNPPTVNIKEVSSSKSSCKRNLTSQMRVVVTHSDSQVSSIQNLESNHPSIAPGLSRLGKTSFIPYKPTPAFVAATSEKQKNHNYNQGDGNKIFFTNLLSKSTSSNNMVEYNLTFMGNGKNYGNGDGSTFFSGLSTSHTTMTPQLTATALLQKAALIGSTTSNTTATKFGGTITENANFVFGNRGFGNSEINKHENNMNELLNSFRTNVSDSPFCNHSGEVTYDQDMSYHDDLDSSSRDYEEHHVKPQSIGNNMGYLQSRGVTFTRDFLGVGGEMVGDISSHGSASDFIG